MFSTHGTATVRVTLRVGGVSWTTVVQGMASEFQGEIALFGVDVTRKAFDALADEEFAGVRLGDVYGTVRFTEEREILAFTPDNF